MSLHRTWTITTLSLAALAGCSDGPRADRGSDPATRARQASHAAADDALRARFANGLQVGRLEIPVSLGSAPGYVPDETCRECHRFDGSRSLGMERSLWKARPAAVVEDFSSAHYYHEPSDRHYEMAYADGAYEVTRYQLDEDGTRYNELSRPVDVIIGSGHKCRAYAYRTPGDELYQLPLAWYTESASWAMPPGYERAEHSGFLRQVTRDCMFCHNGYPEVPVGSDRVGQPHRFPKELPEGLGCQRCHGPGAEHVAAANDPEPTREELRELIFNPGRLEPERQADVCLQCHLQPDSSMMSIVKRLGRGDYTYRPDQPLGDFIGQVDHDGGEDGGEDRFQINHHPYRLFQSRCHIASEGRLTCLTCHDPHEKLPEEQRSAHYRNACLSCHQLEQCDTAAMRSNADSIEAVDCVGCHMPRRRTQDVIEVVMTDHLIRRQPPEQDLTSWRPRAPGTKPGARSVMRGPWHGDPSGDGSPELLADLSGSSAGDRASIERLRDAIESGAATEVDALVYLAVGQSKLGAHSDAVLTYRRALELAPDLSTLQRLLGRALIETGQVSEALTALERARELDPQDPETSYGLALARHRLGHEAQALAAFRETLRLRPLHADAHLGLASLLAKREQYTEAAEAYRWVHRIDPARAEGYYYGGAMLLLTGEHAAAATSWRRGRRAVPDDVPLAAAAAAGLFYEESFEEALAASDAAASAGADAGVCSLVRAMAHDALGAHAEARATLARARTAPGAAGMEAVLRAVLLREARALLESSGD